MSPSTRSQRAAVFAQAALASFGAYYGMYGFRKAFAAGTFAETLELGPLGRHDLKAALLVAQVCGYCLSKFVGVKLVSEIPASRRTGALLAALVAAEVALVAFALVPTPLAPLCLFANGLPLGLTWGLVYGHLEGRRASDALGAILCASFIVASGFAKTVGKQLLDHGVPERWMPAAAGALYLLPTLAFVGLLARVPPPDEADERDRARREPMDAAARRRFLVELGPGLAALVLAYVGLTAYRDLRDNYARELWDALGHGASPALLTTAEVPVAVGSLVAVGLVSLVNDNRRALDVVHGLMIGGALLVGVSTWLHRAGVVGPVGWMVTAGLGLYVGYVPFNCVLFDRLVAAQRRGGNAGFAIYVADAFGYLGSVLMIVIKSFAAPKVAWLPFFEGASLGTALVATVALAFSARYFRRTSTASA